MTVWDIFVTIRGPRFFFKRLSQLPIWLVAKKLCHVFFFYNIYNNKISGKIKNGLSVNLTYYHFHIIGIIVRICRYWIN